METATIAAIDPHAPLGENTRPEVDRMRNKPVSCTVVGLGELQFRELGLEELFDLSDEVLTLLRSTVKGVDFKATDYRWVAQLIKDRNLFRCLKVVVAASCGKKPEDFGKELKISDWLKICITLKSVVDWKEIKELFFQIVPKSLFDEVRQKLAKRGNPALLGQSTVASQEQLTKSPLNMDGQSIT